MKVLYVTTISNTVNAFLIPHIKLLIEKGHKVDVAFNVVQEIDPELVEMGCKIHNVAFQRSPISKQNYVAYKKLRRIMKDEDYDMVHVHTPIASIITRIACRDILDLKIVYTAHGFHFMKGAPIKSWLIYYPIERLVARWTDILITINHEDYNVAKRFRLRSKGKIYKVNGVGIDLNKFEPQIIEKKIQIRKEYGYKEDDFILFYAAELNYNKHQDLLIDVVNILKDKIPNIKLLLAGSDTLENEYKEQVKQLGVGNNIEFLGYRGDIPNLLMLSDIAVASSRREGLPVNVMEAMATGLPLVVTNVRGHRDLVDDGENGYVIGVNDIEGFVKSIEKLHKDNELRHKLGRRGLELVQKYSLESVLKEMKSIYVETSDYK